MKKGIWIRNKIVPYYLKGAKFALAMLLTEKHCRHPRLQQLFRKKE